jgi:hypothetical protein
VAISIFRNGATYFKHITKNKKDLKNRKTKRNRNLYELLIIINVYDLRNHRKKDTATKMRNMK